MCKCSLFVSQKRHLYIPIMTKSYDFLFCEQVIHYTAYRRDKKNRIDSIYFMYILNVLKSGLSKYIHTYRLITWYILYILHIYIYICIWNDVQVYTVTLWVSNTMTFLMDYAQLLNCTTFFIIWCTIISPQKD